MSKKKKSRRRSSSSEDAEKITITTKAKTKRKHASNNEKNNASIRKTPVPSSSEKETQSKRQIKKPVYKLEKSKRGQSPIFKTESQDGQVASSSQDIFLPTAESIGQKKEGTCTPVKRRRDISPHNYHPKFKETKKSSLVPQVIPPQSKNDTERDKNKHHRQEQKSSKAKMKSKISSVAPSVGTASTPTSIKAIMPSGQQQIRKKIEFKIVRPCSGIGSKTHVDDKLIKSFHQQKDRRDHKPSCEVKSSSSVKPPLQQSKMPATVTSKASVPSIKMMKTFPGHQKKKCATVLPQPPSMLQKFKIPKKSGVPELSSAVDNQPLHIKGDHANLTCETTNSFPRRSSSTAKFSHQDAQKQDTGPSHDSFSSNAELSLLQDQLLVVEQLHKTRSERLVEVNEKPKLTCMEIDPPEEGAAEARCKELPHSALIVVLDTNILIGHLEYVKQIVSRGLEVVLIPWIVLQELDSLKKGRGVSQNSVADLAILAISYIYNCLKGKESRLWVQSGQQAAESNKSIKAQNNDDHVLQCCLQYQRLYPECAVILCTNDKNLCNKALVSGVEALTKIDFETKVDRSNQGTPLLQNLRASITPKATYNILAAPGPDNIHVQSQETTSLCEEKGNNQPQKANVARSLLCQFESVLQEALSDVLEAEMKAAYDDIWLEIVYRKPPWSLSDVLQCLKKHWIAVFGHVLSRDKHQNVLNLIEFFTSGKARDHNSTVAALQDAKDLLEEFATRSSRVPGAVSAVDSMLSSLQTQGESSGSDVVMKEAEEDKRAALPPVSDAEVWSLFGNIWDNVFQTSLQGFKALDFDPKAPQRVRPTGGAPPPQDALACLHKLLCLVSQLLQAFNSFLTSTDFTEAQSLLTVMQSTEIPNVDKLTAADLLNCFAQEEYREKLRTGGIQLLQLQAALSSCMESVGVQP